MKTLPDKLSDLIELALLDLIKCERSNKYKVYMGFWHRHYKDDDNDKDDDPDNLCHVCLAGSVMAKSLGSDISKTFYPEDFPDSIIYKMYALDYVRTYWVRYAVCVFLGTGISEETSSKIDEFIDDMDRCRYEDDPGIWKRNMRKIARVLRELGL